MPESNIAIKTLYELEEIYQAAELQKIYWGESAESLVPAHMMFTITRIGGHVLAAMDGNRMVGLLIGLLGTNIEMPDRPAMANLLIASKRMVVLPEYRGRGIGYQLKVKQRQIAIEQGVRLVTWTFDPLLAANAHLNLHKLGCICPKYLEDYYGTDESTGLVKLGSSDRLVVEWWVTNRRVKERLEGTRPAIRLEQFLESAAVIVNPSNIVDGIAHPVDNLRDPLGAFALLEIPTNYTAITESNPLLAKAWRVHTRAAFRYLLREGYIITDFLRTNHEGHDRGFYLLSYNSPAEFNLN